MLRLGAIGCRNHAERMIRLADASGLGRVELIHHPGRRLDDPRYTDRFEDLLDCDAVLVLSPNGTHADYLRQLAARYGGYVFCEKPPVNTLADLESMSSPPERTFFNFNLRFSLLRRSIETALASGQLGRIVACRATVTHGLAFKDFYPSSWRADGAKHPHGVAETVAVHYVDLFILLLGAPRKVHYVPGLISGRGSAYDTCRLLLSFADGVTADVLTSYAAPLENTVEIIGTEGILTLSNGVLKLCRPRDTFNEAGFFVTPPVEEEHHFDGDAIYEESLAASMRIFLEACRDKTQFPSDLFEKSIATNRLILSLAAHQD
jgi:predicted dehydrogenase